jgi:hypothetical protein
MMWVSALSQQRLLQSWSNYRRGALTTQSLMERADISDQIIDYRDSSE